MDKYEYARFISCDNRVISRFLCVAPHSLSWLPRCPGRSIILLASEDVGGEEVDGQVRSQYCAGCINAVCISEPLSFPITRESCRRNSAFGHLDGWRLKSFIVKAGDDLRKEMLAIQLIEMFQEVFANDRVDIILRPYQIISTGHSSGLVEFVEGAMSVDSIKKSSPDSPTLKTYFQHGLQLGEAYTPMFGAGMFF